MITKPPLHIDFVKTFENVDKTQGYWFITWIISKDHVEVWMKCSDRGWNLVASNMKDMWPINSGPSHNRKDVNFIYNDFVRAKNEKAKELDEILFKYMNDNGFAYKHPYKYWIDPDDPPHPLDTPGI
jgi:hypothetical protein